MTFGVSLAGLVLWGLGFVMFTHESSAGPPALGLMLAGAVALGAALLVSRLRSRVGVPVPHSDLDLLRRCLEDCRRSQVAVAESIDGEPASGHRAG